MPLLPLNMEEGQSLEAENSPQLTASKENGPLFYNQKEWNNANILNELGSRLTSIASRNEYCPADTLILAG